MNKKVVLFLILFVSIPVLLFSNAADVQGAEKVKVRWFVGLGTGSREEQIEPQEKVVADFNKSQDEIELVLEIVPNAQAYDVLATQITAGNVLDIVGPVGIRGRDSFKGSWLDMQPLVDKTKYDLSDFDPALVDFYRVEGEGLLGLPFGIYPSFIFVNKDLFDEAGLPYPPQEFGAPPDLAAWEFLDYIAVLKGVTEPTLRQRQVDEMLELTHLVDVADRRIKTYSGGDRKGPQIIV